MTDSDDYGDSDDEALLFAATQADASQAAGGFEVSPRPSKRRKTNDHGGSNASGDDLDDDELLNGEDGEESEEEPAKQSKYLMHAPKINANMDRVVLTQTQQAPAPTQPWMIRGPIWRKPKPVERPVLVNKTSNFQTTITKGSEDAAPRHDSDDDDEAELPAARIRPRLGGPLPRVQL
jgi:ATP-dependent DNA helicase MPH1